MSDPITDSVGHGQIVDKLLALGRRLHISYCLVFESALDDFAPIVAELAGR